MKVLKKLYLIVTVFILAIFMIKVVVDIINQNKMDVLILKTFYNPELKEIKDFYWRSESINISAVSKWIVLTASHYSLQQILEISLIDGWNVVVVGSHEALSNVNRQNFHYLGLEKQEELRVRFNLSLPENVYSLKNLGYAYAIQHGAEWIYDVDNGVVPTEHLLSQFDYTNHISGMQYEAPESKLLSDKLFDPLQYFGGGPLRQRGFPIRFWKDHKNCGECITLCRKIRTSSVQHGIDSSYMDVDNVLKYVYNLEHRNVINKFAGPITVKGGAFSPWNSHSTLFNKRAFFLLYVPSIGDRVADIVRSYFAQKLLHKLGETIAFYPNNIMKNTNFSMDVNMIAEESFLHGKLGELIAFLDLWKCKSNDISVCFVTLAKELSDHDFWSFEDYHVAVQWVAMLRSLRYEFPMVIDREPRSNWPRLRNCRRAYINFNKKESLSKQKIEALFDLDEWCRAVHPLGIPLRSLTAEHLEYYHKRNEGLAQKEETVLIIINNYPWKDSIGLLQRIYEGYFGLTIFCGSFKWIKRVTEDFPTVSDSFCFVEVHEEELLKGTFLYYCLAKVAEMRLRNVAGYFVSADDLFFNFWHKIDLSQAFHPVGIRSSHKVRTWYPGIIGTSGLKRTKVLVKTIYKNYPLVQNIWSRYQSGINQNYNRIDAFQYLTSTNGFAPSDLFYVPATEITYFAGLMELFFEAGVFKGIAVIKFLATVNHTVPPISKSVFLWLSSRASYLRYYNSDIIVLHPLKPSKLKNQRHRRKFCSSVLRPYFRALMG